MSDRASTYDIRGMVLGMVAIIDPAIVTGDAGLRAK